MLDVKIYEALKIELIFKIFNKIYNNKIYNIEKEY